VELSAHVGQFRAGSDEGSLGNAAVFRGAVTLPLTRRLAVAFDVQTARVTRRRSGDNFRTSRLTLLAPSPVYRGGGAHVYVFAGGGVGAEHESTLWRVDDFADWHTPGFPSRQVRPRVFETDHRELSYLSHAKAGFVVSPAPRLPVRAETYFANWYWGLRIGAGYRFSRR
jgi:hypothetical protein